MGVCCSVKTSTREAIDCEEKRERAQRRVEEVVTKLYYQNYNYTLALSQHFRIE